jgi:hypothetical protein
VNAQQLLEDYGLRLPELDEERAREAEERWQRHLVEDYERWLTTDALVDLEEDQGGSKVWNIPQEHGHRTSHKSAGWAGRVDRSEK